MDQKCDIKPSLMESKCNTQPTNDSLVDDDDNVWQDLIGIAPDPPDRREKCEKCQ